MTDPLVVDASAALKWVLAEEHSDSARSLLRGALTEDRSIVAPPLLPGEATNAIYQRQRRKHISPREADRALATFLAFPIHLLSPVDLHNQALELARRYHLPATYDAQYLVVALSLGADFWTADEKLYNALPRSLRWVHWIGELPATPSAPTR
ncbi:MAG: type II toxin-antitoxin system VapC family toxin [Dehalococcoidia bacterium]